jgi:hypothetical protein
MIRDDSRCRHTPPQEHALKANAQKNGATKPWRHEEVLAIPRAVLEPERRYSESDAKALPSRARNPLLSLVSKYSSIFYVSVDQVKINVAEFLTGTKNKETVPDTEHRHFFLH